MPDQAHTNLSFTSLFVVRALWVLTVSAVVTTNAYAQGGLRDSLERLDRDQDGRLDPEEITPLSRPFLERIGRYRRLSLDRSNRIDEWQEAARIYFATQNGSSGRGIRYEGEKMIKGFEPGERDALIPEFGLAELKYDYIQADLDEADRTLGRYDRNRDGFIDRDEAARSKWTHRDPFEMDLNKDDRLSRLELGQRYARRRLLEGSSDELIQQAQRVGNGVRPSSNNRDDGDDDRRSWWRRGSRYYLTSSVMDRFDRNRNGRLESSEAKALGFSPSQIDVDRNGELSREELHDFLSARQEEAGDESEGLPGWFFELDADRDGQVAMSEFTDEWTEEKLAEFSSLDANDDGLLTSREVAESKAQMGGSFANTTAQVLAPRKTIISEIEIIDGFEIADVDLKLSITHSNTSDLDAHLTGPNGQRIELFSDIGGSGNHFEGTVFDDESSYPIIKSRPPYQGRFQPEGRSRGKPGLSQFNGTNSQGVWQLVIRATRSERFGVLHEWSLVFRPRETMLDLDPNEPPTNGEESAVPSKTASQP